jgi:4-pyridoxate dehydrogenase
MSDQQTFDYIIVGAGSAGCLLAARLSEDKDVRVLLLEAGGSNRDPLIHIPLGLGKMHEYRLHDWGYETEPEPELGGRRIDTMRGKVIGGSHSINVMAYVRGKSGDYDRWAQKGCTGWSYADVLPYFRRSESFEGGADPWRGGAGPMAVEYSRSTDSLNEAWVEAAKAAGIGHTPDFNGAQEMGVGRSQFTINKGRRCSTAVAFLRPAMARPNLTVVTRALASRIVLAGTRAVGSEYQKGGRTVSASAEREVILSGGVINTPQLLMLSGIGPADHLSDMGVEPVHDLKGVGQNLQDHLGMYLFWARKTPGPFRADMRFDRMAVHMLRAHFFGTGPATVLPSGMHGFVKSRPELAVPDIQLTFRGAAPKAHLWFPLIRPAYADGFGLRPTMVHPESRGEIRLRSADPQDKVRISQRFFTSPNDLPTLRQGFKIARDLAEQTALDPYRGAELAPGPDVKTDNQIDAWIRKAVSTAHHPCGTCAMGITEDAVLDADLRVRGIDGLRVADASAMPDLVSGAINASVIMIAEKAADLIRGRGALPPARDLPAG